MSSDPTNVCCTPVHVIGLVVKHQFEGGCGVEHVAADSVKNPLGENKGQTPGARMRRAQTSGTSATLGFPVEPLV